MSKAFPAVKDPDEVKDYGIDWSPLMVDDAILTSDWSVVDGTVVIDSNSHTDTATTVWLSGGVEGDVHLLNRVTTGGGRTYDQTVKLKVKTK